MKTPGHSLIQHLGLFERKEAILKVNYVNLEKEIEINHRQKKNNIINI